MEEYENDMEGETPEGNGLYINGINYSYSIYKADYDEKILIIKFYDSTNESNNIYYTYEGDISKFKKDIRLWYKEMDNYGLTKQEQAILRPYLEGSYGICETQELFMKLVQVPELGGFDLTWSDRLRKAIAKKAQAKKKPKKRYRLRKCIIRKSIPYYII